MHIGYFKSSLTTDHWSTDPSSLRRPDRFCPPATFRMLHPVHMLRSFPRQGHYWNGVSTSTPHLIMGRTTTYYLSIADQYFNLQVTEHSERRREHLQQRVLCTLGIDSNHLCFSDPPFRGRFGLRQQWPGSRDDDQKRGGS